MFQLVPTYAVVLIYVIVGLLGLVLGSALNCLSYRIAHNQKWSGHSRSACPHCGHTLGSMDLIPVFSYLALKGRCRYCKEKISPRYPITEAVLCVCFITLVARFQLSLQTVSAMILCSCLFCLSLVDLEIQIIPDRFLVIPAVVRTAQLFWESGWQGFLRGIFPGICIGAGILIFSLVMDRILKKDTMGGGDIKLLAVLGMYLPLPQCMVLLIIACVIGILIGAVLMKKKPDTPFPFGPAISLAGWITLLFGDRMIDFYLGLFM